jgi:hypothetical protein
MHALECAGATLQEGGRAVAGDGKPVAAFRAVVGARRYRRDLGRRRRSNRCWFRCRWWGGAAGAVHCSGAAGAFTCSAYRVADSQHRQDHQQSERRETLAPPPRAALRHPGVSRGRALSWRRTRTSVDLFREHPIVAHVLHSPPPHANSFVIGPAAIKHTRNDKITELSHDLAAIAFEFMTSSSVCCCSSGILG